MSKYSLSWLAQNSYEGKKKSSVQPRILWNSDIYQNANVPSAKWETFMSCDDELKKFLHNYLLYGIAFVDDVPATVEATEAVCQRVSLIRYRVLLLSFAAVTLFLLAKDILLEGVVPCPLIPKTLVLFLYVLFTRETTYGRMWCFTSDFSRGDTAYSQLALDRHTDTSYLQEPCGLVHGDGLMWDFKTVPIEWK